MGFCREEHQEARGHQAQTQSRSDARRIRMTQIWPLFLKKPGLKAERTSRGRGDGQPSSTTVITAADPCSAYVMDQSMKIKDATGKDVFTDQVLPTTSINMVSSWRRRQHRLRQRPMPTSVKRSCRRTTKASKPPRRKPKARRAGDPRCNRRAQESDNAERRL